MICRKLFWVRQNENKKKKPHLRGPRRISGETPRITRKWEDPKNRVGLAVWPVWPFYPGLAPGFINPPFFCSHLCGVSALVWKKTSSYDIFVTKSANFSVNMCTAQRNSGVLCSISNATALTRTESKTFWPCFREVFFSLAEKAKTGDSPSQDNCVSCLVFKKTECTRGRLNLRPRRSQCVSEVITRLFRRIKMHKTKLTLM